MRQLLNIFTLAATLTLSSAGSSTAQVISDSPVVIFSADDGVHGRELWVTDGTRSGTQLLADIHRGPDDSGPQWLVATEDGRVFFQADDGRHGAELWVTDGTPDGTRMVRDIREGPESSEPITITYIGDGRVVFNARTDEAGRETWISDGSFAGTFQLVDATPGPDSGSPRNFLRVSDAQFMFGAERNGERRIWVSDATPDGTKMLRGQQRDFTRGVPISETMVVFRADHPTLGRQPWLYDVTSSDRPTLLRRLNRDSSSMPSDFTLLADGQFVFSAIHPVRGRELYKSDGTRSGTRLLKDLVRGAASSSPSQFTPLSEQGDVMLFRTSGVSEEDVAPTLWRTDGTRKGTTRVKGRVDVTDMVRIANGVVVFSGFDPRNESTIARGRTPWVSDGTREGTFTLGRTNGLGLSSSGDFTAIGAGQAIFASVARNRGRELFITDGTREGTTLLKDINRGAEPSSPSNFTPLAMRSIHQP